MSLGQVVGRQDVIFRNSIGGPFEVKFNKSANIRIISPGVYGVVKNGGIVCLCVRADKEFLANFPEDARYFLDGVVLKIDNGVGEPVTVRNLGSTEMGPNSCLCFSLWFWIRGLLCGKSLYLVVERVCRVNSEGEVIEEPFSMRELSVRFIKECE